MPVQTIKSLLLILLTPALGLTVAANEAEVDSVLAAVNGDPVTLGEILPAVRDREFQLKSAYSGKVLEEEILKARYLAVEEIIDRKLIVADFNAQNLVLSNQDVENELDRWGKLIGCPSRKDLEEKIRQSGTTVEKLRERVAQRIKVQIMRRRAFAMAGSPSPADLYERFKQEEKLLNFPGSVELALLKLPLNDTKNAEDYFKKAIATKPDLIEAKHSLALIYENNNKDKAKELYIEILEQDPTNKEIKDALANLASSDY